MRLAAAALSEACANWNGRETMVATGIHTRWPFSIESDNRACQYSPKLFDCCKVSAIWCSPMLYGIARVAVP